MIPLNVFKLIKAQGLITKQMKITDLCDMAYTAHLEQRSYFVKLTQIES
jgi:hypothetical protein